MDEMSQGPKNKDQGPKDKSQIPCMSDNQLPKGISRKTFIRQSLTLGAGAIALSGVMAGCGLLDEPEMLLCSKQVLDQEGSFIAKFNRHKVMATFLDEELVVFSLVCRHRKCTVKYQPEEETFLCPCHDGLYDKYGKVLDGPPPGPLYRMKYEIRGDEVWVLNEKV
jgi:cytochrome b6-f complex iron-sulfur subunit